MICFFESVKTPTVGPMLAYLIFVTGTKGGACVKKNARCKFLQIYSVIYEKLTIYCVIYAFFGVNLAMFTDLTQKIGNLLRKIGNLLHNLRVFQCKSYAPKVLPV